MIDDEIAEEDDSRVLVAACWDLETDEVTRIYLNSSKHVHEKLLFESPPCYSFHYPTVLVPECISFKKMEQQRLCPAEGRALLYF